MFFFLRLGRKPQNIFGRGFSLLRSLIVATIVQYRNVIKMMTKNDRFQERCRLALSAMGQASKLFSSQCLFFMP